MGIQPEIRVKRRGREREKKRERETQEEPDSQETRPRDLVQETGPSFIVQKAFYTFDNTWRSMGNTKLCSISSPDSYQNEAFLSAYLIVYTSLR